MKVKKFPSLFRKRRVMLDSNVLISAIAYKTEDSVAVMDKAKNDDFPVMTSVVRDECVDFTKKKKCRISKKQMEKELDSFSDDIVDVKLPKQNVLKSKYRIRDEDDYKVLHAAEVADADILVTGDEDFYDNVKGPKKTIVIRPKRYLSEIRPLYFLRRTFFRRGI